MKITIDTDWRGHLVARNEHGNKIASRNPYCNPAAMAQIICDAGGADAIDWKNSTVAAPEQSES